MNSRGVCSHHIAFSILLVAACAATEANASNQVIFDARAISPPTTTSSYIAGSSMSPTGREIGVNSMYLTLDGKPWLPVMGEFHYSRVPASDWEAELLKMKISGVQVISTYAIWIHHEEVEGQFDWSGERDLRKFVLLCAKHGLYVVVRIGPWVHGEARNGGLPDWVVRKGETRKENPEFINNVSRYFEQIGNQLRGLMWRSGGPIIGVQIENEYSERGPGKGEEYLLALKKLAVNNGMDVPLYTLTGWDNAVLPDREFLPVYGGYPDAPWDASLSRLAPSEVYLFRFSQRDSGEVAVRAAAEAEPSGSTTRGSTPFLTAEMGGGIEDTYHRRPLLTADDVAAEIPTMLGSGINLYGTYMFQGGANPEGTLTTLEESQRIGSINDLPIKSYDFQAPLGRYGQERESFRKMKVFQYFLNEFGAELAPMQPHAPIQRPRNAKDLSVIRASIRTHGDMGFLFVNNHVRGANMPIRHQTQFTIKFPTATIELPDHPIDIPTDAYFIWPFNFDLGGVQLHYATAQLFTRTEDDEGVTYFFAKTTGVRTELVLQDASELHIAAPGAEIEKRGGFVHVFPARTGIANSVVLQMANSSPIRLVILSQSEAEHSWRVRIADHDRLVQTDLDIYADEHQMVLDSRRTPNCSFSVFPPMPGHLRINEQLAEPRQINGISFYGAQTPEIQIPLAIEKVEEAGKAPPVLLGPPRPGTDERVPSAPPESVFANAAEWRIYFPEGLPKCDVREVFLDVKYIGDIARLESRGKLLDDNFFNGAPWEIGLRRFVEAGTAQALQLRILPLRSDSPVYFERRYRPKFTSRQIVEFKNASLISEYEFVVQTE